MIQMTASTVDDTSSHKLKRNASGNNIRDYASYSPHRDVMQASGFNPHQPFQASQISLLKSPREAKQFNPNDFQQDTASYLAQLKNRFKTGNDSRDPQFDHQLLGSRNQTVL